MEKPLRGWMMMAWREFIRRSIYWLTRGGVRDFHDREDRRKIAMSNIIRWVGLGALIPMGFLAFRDGNPILGVFDLSAAVALIFTQIYSRLTGKFTFTHYFGITCIALLFLFLNATGGVQSTGHLWLFTFPLIAFFLLGCRHGGIATLTLFLSILAVWTVQFFIPVDRPYSLPFQIRLIVSFLVVFLFAYSFEKFRSEAQESLEKQQAELEKRVQERTEDLKKARDVLDEKVQERTASLQQANKELRSEIRERERVEISLKEAKAAAETASRAKSEFLANMSHELRTPLNHILGFTELVADKQCGDLNPDQEEYLKDVLQSGQHLLALINDILDLSKVEAGKLALQVTDLNLRLLLENSLHMIREKALKHRIKLVAENNGIPEVIQADERKMKQILYNLLSNAVKFTPDGGSVRLRARLSSEFGIRNSELEKETEDSAIRIPQSAIQISVEDTGIGIQREDLQRIFDPFEQVESSASRRFQGTGLGLSLTKRLVELHGGRIWAESAGERKGSKFAFIIPVETGVPIAEGERMDHGK